MMGNLARAAFPASTKAVWPWSYDSCDPPSVPHLDQRQEINACQASPGHGLHPFQGRGSPEVDLFEVNSLPGTGVGSGSGTGKHKASPAFMSASLQVSPGVPSPGRPINGHPLNASYTWYEGIEMSDAGEYNEGFWGQEVLLYARMYL
jgi:beta-glucan synthesis-associated protein KRE6